MNERTISVIGLEDREVLGPIKWIRSRKKVETEDLKKEVNQFMEDMQEIIDSVPESKGGFHLDTIEIHADVSAKGKLSLLGSGGEIGGAAGIKFVLRRNS